MQISYEYNMLYHKIKNVSFFNAKAVPVFKHHVFEWSNHVIHISAHILLFCFVFIILLHNRAAWLLCTYGKLWRDHLYISFCDQLLLREWKGQKEIPKLWFSSIRIPIIFWMLLFPLRCSVWFLAQAVIFIPTFKILSAHSLGYKTIVASDPQEVLLGKSNMPSNMHTHSTINISSEWKDIKQ